MPAAGSRGAFGRVGNCVATNASRSGHGLRPLTANAVAGGYTVVASAAGVGAPTPFRLTNKAGAAATVAAIQGSGQSAAINTAFTMASSRRW